MTFRSFALGAALSLIAGGAIAAAHADADGNPMVGGAAMFDTQTLGVNAVNSADHTTRVDAVQAAGRGEA
ncbi:MAG: fasciclin domain-containing protein, partial [Pseudomonadota bacterium]